MCTMSDTNVFQKPEWLCWKMTLKVFKIQKVNVEKVDESFKKPVENENRLFIAS